MPLPLYLSVCPSFPTSVFPSLHLYPSLLSLHCFRYSLLLFLFSSLPPCPSVPPSPMSVHTFHLFRFFSSISLTSFLPRPSSLTPFLCHSLTLTLTHFVRVILSDEGLTLETSVFESFTVVNLPYGPCG